MIEWEIEKKGREEDKRWEIGILCFRVFVARKKTSKNETNKSM